MTRRRWDPVSREWRVVTPTDWLAVVENDPGPYMCSKATIEGFFSRQLPRNYDHHQGKFDAQGRPIFTGKREVRETEACATDHGEVLKHGEL